MVGGHLALSLHSSDEPGELSQWYQHHLKIVIGISISSIISTPEIGHSWLLNLRERDT